MAIALSIAYTATPLAAVTKLVVEATPQLSAGVTFIAPSRYRQIQVGGVAGASPLSILTAYNAKFGVLITGKRIAFRLTEIGSTGLRGQPFFTSVIVT